MFLLDQPEMEPTLTDARIVQRTPGAQAPAPRRTAPAHDRWHTARVVVGLVSATVVFQQGFGLLLTWWFGI